MTSCTLLGFAPYMSARTPCYMLFVIVVVVVVGVVDGGPMAKACDISSLMFSHVHSQSLTYGD